MSIEQIKRANKEAGFHWFEADTMRFFSSRVGEKTWKSKDGTLFISSEQREWNTPRCYTIRLAKSDGSIDTVGDFMAYNTRWSAESALKHLLNDAA